MNKGKLININLGNGRSVKMYEADAIAQGLAKARPPVTNKMQKPSQNKAAKDTPPEEKTSKNPVEEKAPPDDFTTIPGIGPATARALSSHGVTTFEQLKAAGALDYLTAKAKQAIEAWRNG